LEGEDSDFELADDLTGEEKNDEDFDLHSPELTRVNLQRYERVLELQQQAEAFMREDNFDMAASLYQSCLGTLSAYLEFKFGDAEPQQANLEKAEMVLSPTIGLAFAQQCLGRLEHAEQSYLDAFELMETKGLTVDPENRARCALNYAELLCQGEKPLKAIECIQKALDQLPNKKSGIYASAMSNIAIYYGILKRFEEALPFAKKGYELFCKVLGKDNPYTESALQSYVRVLRDSGKGEEADRLHEEWEASRRAAELPTQDDMQRDISAQLAQSLKHFSEKKTLDPHGIVVPPEVLEDQKRTFAQRYAEADLGEKDFVDAIEPELKSLYELIGKSKDFHGDMEKFRADPEYAKETLASGIGAPILNLGIDEYYSSKSDLPRSSD
jgi:tetratricopeptide (TPR) repeat protein